MKKEKTFTLKRFISFLLIMCMMLSAVPLSAFAEDAVTGSFDAVGGKVTYKVENDSIVITGGEASVTEIEFPDTVDGLPVKAIDSNAFNNYTVDRSALVSVKLPSTLESIGNSAFYGCENLSTVDFSACGNLTSIGEMAFDDAKALTSVSLPSSLTELGATAFANSGLTSIDLSNCSGLTVINEDVFCRNKSLTSVKLPLTVKSIGKGAFQSCTSLTDIDLSLYVMLESIGDDAFNFTPLTTVRLPEGVKTLGMSVFSQCEQLESADLSACKLLKVLPSYCFRDCYKLSTLLLPTSLEEIDTEALKYCFALESVDFSAFNNLTIIDNEAFYGDDKLSSVKLSPSLTEIGEFAFEKAAITSISIPETIEVIGKGAFDNCQSLSEVIWPEECGLTILTGFSNCISLPQSVYEEGVAFPSVTAIGDGAFSNCSFESVTIPSHIKTIGECAFGNNDTGLNQSKLKSVTISSGVETIGESAFTMCPIEGILNIPSTVKTVGAYAFEGTEISGLNIENGVERIELWAFANCDSLAGTTVVLPETVSYVGESAFEYCGTSANPISFEIRNRDVEFEASTSQSPFGWVNDDMHIIVRAYEYNSNGENSASYNLYLEYLNETDKNDSTFEFYAIPDEAFAVTGTVPEGAKVKLYINSSELPVSVTDGKFSVLADKGADVGVRVSLNGYYDKHFIKQAISEKWDLGEITFTESDKVPANKLMRVDFTGESVSSFDEVSLVLSADGKTLSEDTDYTLQFPYIALTDNVTAQEITLCVNADSISCTGSEATAKRENGVFEIKLTPWGKLNITARSDFAGDNNILVFNSNGSLVSKGCVSNGGLLVTDSLKAGEYTIIAFNANDSFSSVASISALSVLGMIQGKDYAQTCVTVTDGETEETDITVPILKTNVASVLNKDTSSVVAENNRILTNSSYRVRVYYSFVNGKKGTVSVTLPEATTLERAYTKTKLLNEGADYTINGNTVIFNTDNSSGMFYVALTSAQEGNVSISVSATADGITAPLGSTLVSVGNLFLMPNSLTASENDNGVSILAAPESVVDLTLDGNTVASGVTDRRGRLTLTYDLPENTYTGRIHMLEAKCGDFTASESVSAKLQNSNSLMLETWYGYNSSNKEKFGLYKSDDSFDIGKDSWYYYLPGQTNNWYIYATFVGSQAPEDVVTYVGMLDSSVRNVPMSLVKSQELNNNQFRYTFVGKLYIPSTADTPTEATLPTDFAIDWTDNAETYVYNEAAVNRAKMLASEETENRERMITRLLEQIDTSGIDEDCSQYIFGAEYRVTGEDWFKDLPEDGKNLFYSLEKSIDDSMQAITDMFGLPKNITEYGSWDEVYEAMGMTVKTNTKSADELREDGYTVCETANGFTAYKEIEKTSVLAKFKAIFSKTATQADVPTVTGFSFVDENGNQVDFEGDAYDNTNQAVVNNAFGVTSELIDAVKDYAESHPEVTTNQIKNIKAAGQIVGGVGNALSLYALWQDASGMADWEKRSAELGGYIDELKLYENRYSKDYFCSFAIMQERHAAELLKIYIDAETKRSKRNSVMGGVFILSGIFDVTGTASTVSGAVYDTMSSEQGIHNAEMINKYLKELNKLSVERQLQCKNTDMEKIMQKTRRVAKVSPLIDPSGTVYEAVESNTLSGVKASVWYAEDENGTNAKLWEAENYGQINPQITDEAGMYAWDVPAGWWQVRFEKDGYLPSETEWLPVPPPQVGLTTAMVSTEAPEVVSAKAYPDYIEVVFSQYMNTEKQLSLPDGMTAQWQDIENGYSKVLHITKQDGFEKGSTVTIALDGAENYAGTALPSYSQQLTVNARPAEIILNYDSVISSKSGVERNVTVRIKDADGNYMPNVTLDAVVGNTEFAVVSNKQTVTDENGVAVFRLQTLLPGYTDITFSVVDTSLKKTVDLDITLEENRPERPTAKIGSTEFTADNPKENFITVKSGEQLEIFAQDGVTVYYTTDDTCPCQNSESRKIYTAPITITENVKFRIAAYKDGMDYSERLNITVTVEKEPFPDVASGEWYYNAVKFNVEKGYFHGYANGYFGPGNNIQRQDFVVVLSKIAGVDLSDYAGQNGGFSDVPTNDYYSAAVAWAKDNHILSGYANGKFGVGDPITREQACLIFYNYCNGEVSGNVNTVLAGYPDGSNVSDWARTAVAWAAENHVVGGNGKLNPAGNANRAEMAQIIMNMSLNGIL